ncbi:MAG: beta-L-arabinofuranosidase domain-containing protein, partial [Lysobacter sp.]
ADVSVIATGKAYQLAWNLIGLAKLHRATGNADYLRAVEHAWTSIREDHLTLGGGPWGGVGHRSREVFNPAGVFSPYGYVETCSTFAWIQLNRELHGITGDARYAEEIERSAYNDLLGAQAPDGENWCYYVFPNGRRVHTTYWRCCKSSGAMALEELPSIAYTAHGAAILAVNLYGPGEASFALAGAGRVRLVQETLYPYPDSIRVRVSVEAQADFAIRLRIPSWVEGGTITINGEAIQSAMVPGQYVDLARFWRDGDEIVARFPMSPVMHKRVNNNTQESFAPDGSEVRQQVLHFEYAAITCGPLVYATELIDGFKVEETLRLPPELGSASLGWLPESADGVPRIFLDPGYRAPLVFAPYFCAGGREDGVWRLTWMQLAPDPAFDANAAPARSR